MKLRVAKKVGRTWPKRHRLATAQRAMARIWKYDVRQCGLPGNMDCYMAIVYRYPTLGGKVKD